MAPRSAKVKKTAEPNKLSDSEAVKKGRGKAKTLNDVEPKSAEIEIEEKIAPDTEKKTRGRKGANSRKEQVNGNSEEIVAPAKKGRVKKEPTPESNNISQKTDLEDIAENDGSHPETNGTSEVASSNGKGRKKQTKKQTSGQGDSQDVANDKKTAKQESDSELKGRGRKTQSKIEPDSEVKEVKEPATKGRKKAPAKVTKGKDTVVEENDQQETKNSEDVEEKPKKSRGRKNQTKKTKDNVEENEEQPDVDSEHGDGPAAKKIKMNEAESKEDDITEAKPAKGKRVRKAAEVAAEPQEVQDSSSVPKRRRNEEKDQDKKKASPKNNKTTDYDSIDFSNNSKNGQGKEWNFKISSWNVDGIRAWLGKGGLDYIKYEKPDILCLQEVKCSREKLPAEIANVPGYHAYWLCSDQDGYAGVGIYTTKLAMNVQYGLGDEQLDSEGRIITAEYEQFYLICTYVPNAGRKLVTLPKRLQWNDAFRKHVKELEMKKPVIICGDMNVAHNEIDLANPKTNQKNAGFTKEERSGMTELLGDGFVDTFRHFYPDKPKAYTFWTYMMNSRQKNVGWRLDYFIVSEKLRPSLCDNKIREQVYGSDHCPIALFLHLTSADKPKNEI